MEIQNLDPRIELFSIKYGLNLGHFADQITLEKPKDMAEFQEKSRGPIKAQVLANFVTEFTDHEGIPNQVETWTLLVDDASNEKGSEADIILENGQGIALEKPFKFQFKANNN
ncbi:hypothetical protein Cni_G29514 [Canna indica]|uniref:Uncharacterized protein n=1 Tax=Canna indica TaxID=4628 RepID=A0AAQ3L8I2_9LILI|nr:hypothetical protein Cni_G29514 [Canna indica]